MSFGFTDLGYFLWFLPLAAILSLWLFDRRVRGQLGILLVMSYLFFFLASGWHLILLIISTIVDWTAGSKIYSTNDKNKRKLWLILSLTTNLGLLAIFKYLDFLIRSLDWWSLNVGILPDEELGLALPVGISFYTFQTMSYTIDIYREKIDPAESFVTFACYAAFFPQLVAGPIVRFNDFRDQVRKELVFSLPRIKLGVTLILYGLVKKLVFADNFAIQVDGIFSSDDSLDNTILIYWATLLFGLQIYCDFSAYTDIALGSAHIFGIQLPENFRSPYKSTSPQDFWRRWHITLSSWLRDYLYISLGGNRKGEFRMFLALILTMVLGGLWHGARINFVFWGIFHGVILIIHRVFSRSQVNKKIVLRHNTSHMAISWAITQWLVFMAWLIFRVEEKQALIRALKSYLAIDSSFDIGGAIGAMPERATYVFVLLSIFIIIHIFSSINEGSTKYHIAKLSSLKWGLMMGVFTSAIFFMRPAEVVQFIYFRF